jgi:tRNA 2-(methylsulfanyl)-N6-isopentenyladenosine37 hydroxylase
MLISELTPHTLLMNMEEINTPEKRVLRLKLPTDPRWVTMASISIEEILTDHAYCEQKAASTCISLVQKNSDKIELVEQLAPIVTEEWGHFRMVLNELKKRNLKLGRQRKDEYVNKLMLFENKSLEGDPRLIELLLRQALVEARSCERFRLLSLHISDESLKGFYHTLMVSEAGHYKLFIDLAKLYATEEYVENRWQEYLDYEAEIMPTLEVRGDRMH